MPHLNGELQPSNVKSIAVYDVANFGTDLFLPLTDVGLTETALTFSGVTMTDLGKMHRAHRRMELRQVVRVLDLVLLKMCRR